MSEIASIQVCNILLWPFFVVFDTFSSNFLGPESLRDPSCIFKTLIVFDITPGAIIRIIYKYKALFETSRLAGIFKPLDPDPHFNIYGPGSRKAKSMRNYADPDPQHWFKCLGTFIMA